jgi:hypothetical protein
LHESKSPDHEIDDDNETAKAMKAHLLKTPASFLRNFTNLSVTTSSGG